MLKRVLAFCAAFLICLSFSISAAAIDFDDIDGYVGQKEWEAGSVYVLKDQHDFLNDVKNAIVSLIFNEDENRMYLLLKCEMKNYDDAAAAKLSFCTEYDSEQTEIDFNGDVLYSPYDVKAAASADKELGITFIEAAIHFKEGLDLPVGIRLYITDCAGIDSNTFTLVYGEEQNQAEDEAGSSSSSDKKTAEKSKAAKSKTSAAKKSASPKSEKSGRTTTEFPFSSATESTAPSFNRGAASATDAAASSSADSRQKTAIIIVGSLCALALVCVGTYAAIKKNKNNQDSDTKQK